MKYEAVSADPNWGNGTWRLMSTPEREREYSPSSCIGGNYQPFLEAYRTQSDEARAGCEALGAQWQELRYGAKPSQRIDLCLPSKAAALGRPIGLLVFIHGGYWQELSAQQSLFASLGCISRGLAFAAIDYTLAPHASLADIVGECRAAMGCLFREAPGLGINAGNIVVAGSSAGAHLAAMVAWPGWAAPGSAGMVPGVRAAVLVSGIYDLEPLVGTSINEALGLDVPAARQQSPANLSLTGFPKTLVAWGDNETAEFKRQSQTFAQSLAAAQACCETLQVSGRNHFDVVLDLVDAGAPLGERTLSFFDAT